jgi:heptosyltransferase-2
MFVARWVNPKAHDFYYNRVKSLLIIKLDEIGDFILLTPFLRELRRNSPQANIELIVKPAVYNLAEMCPYVNEVLVYDWSSQGKRCSLLRRQWRALSLAVRQLRWMQFDVAIIPRWDADTYHATQLAVYSGARAIVAFSEGCTVQKRIVNRGFDRMVSHIIDEIESDGHEVSANLAILKKFGAVVESSELEIWLSPEDEEFAGAALEKRGRCVAIATGASKRYKQWPRDRFSELAIWLKERYGLTPLLFGAFGDPRLQEAVDFLGLTLRQTAAMIARCDFFVGNDSGLKHIAAAVNTPVVEINALRFGGLRVHPNSPARFRAWNVAQRIVQPPHGTGECAINEIPLVDVKMAVGALLTELSEGKS